MSQLKVLLWPYIGFFAKRICVLQSFCVYCKKQPRHQSKQPGPCPALPSPWTGTIKDKKSKQRQHFPWQRRHLSVSRRSSPGLVLVPMCCIGPPATHTPYAVNCLLGIGYKCAFNWAPLLPLPPSFSERRLNARGDSPRFIRHHPGVPPPLSLGPTKERSFPCQVGCGDQLRSSRAELHQFVQPAPAENTPDREA